MDERRLPARSRRAHLDLAHRISILLYPVPIPPRDLIDATESAARLLSVVSNFLYVLG